MERKKSIGLAARKGSMRAVAQPPNSRAQSAAKTVPTKQPPKAVPPVAQYKRSLSEILKYVDDLWGVHGASISCDPVDVSVAAGALVLPTDGTGPSIHIASLPYPLTPSGLGGDGTLAYIHAGEGVINVPVEAACGGLRTIKLSNSDRSFKACFEGGSVLEGRAPTDQSVTVYSVERDGCTLKVAPLDSTRYIVTYCGSVGESCIYEGQWSSETSCAEGDGVWKSTHPTDGTYTYSGGFSKGQPHGIGYLNRPIAAVSPFLSSQDGAQLSLRGRFERGSLIEGGAYLIIDGEERRVAERTDSGDWVFHTMLPRAFNAPTTDDGALRPTTTNFVVSASDVKELSSNAPILAFGASVVDSIATLQRTWPLLWSFPSNAFQILNGVSRSNGLTAHLAKLRSARLQCAVQARDIVAETTKLKKLILAIQTKENNARNVQREEEERAAKLLDGIRNLENELEAASTALDDSGTPITVNPLTYRVLQEGLLELEAKSSAAFDALSQRKKKRDTQKMQQAALDKQRRAEIKRIETLQSNDRDAAKKLSVEKAKLDAELQLLNDKLHMLSRKDATSKDRTGALESLVARATAASKEAVEYEKLIAAQTAKFKALEKERAVTEGSIEAETATLTHLQSVLEAAKAQSTQDQIEAEAAQVESEADAKKVAAAKVEVTNLTRHVAELRENLDTSRSDVQSRAARHQRSMKNFADRTSAVLRDIDAIKAYDVGLNQSPSTSPSDQPEDDTPALVLKLSALDSRLAALSAEKANLERVLESRCEEAPSSSSNDLLQRYKLMTVPELKSTTAELKAANKVLKASISELEESVRSNTQQHQSQQAEIHILRSKGTDPRTQILQNALDALDAEAVVLREAVQRIPQLEAKLMAMEEQTLVKQTSTDLARRRMSMSGSNRPHHLPGPSGTFAYQRWQAPAKPQL